MFCNGINILYDNWYISNIWERTCLKGALRLILAFLKLLGIFNLVLIVFDKCKIIFLGARVLEEKKQLLELNIELRTQPISDESRCQSLFVVS